MSNEALSTEELQELLKLQFALVAQTMAELTKRKGDKVILKLSGPVDGADVSAVLQAQIGG